MSLTEIILFTFMGAMPPTWELSPNQQCLCKFLMCITPKLREVKICYKVSSVGRASLKDYAIEFISASCSSGASF